MVQHMNNFPLKVGFFLSLFPSVALGAGEESARLSENRAVETWNSLNVSSFCFYFEGLGSGVRASSQGDNQGKWKPLTHQPSTKKRKNSPKCTSFPPLVFVSTFSFCLFLFFMTCLRSQQGRSSSCWTSEGSSGPSRSSRRCSASSGPAALEEGSGSIYRLGWSDRSY